MQEFQFKLQFRLRAFQREKCIDIKRPRKILCSSSKYGLTFIGCPTGVQCINTANIVSLYENQQNNRKYICDYPRRELSIGETPSHLDISSDSELLAVAITIQNCPVLYVYSVPSFGSKDILKKYELRLSNTSGVEVLDVQWNPRLQNILAAVLSDGSVIACEFKQGSYSLNTLPGNVQATCICWSPKGKQIVIGAANGTLSQYRPELKLVKSFPPPQLNNPVATVSVQWLSSFQFAAVYKDTANPSQGPVLIIVNVPKGAPINYVNYEGICFGSRSGRPEHFFIHQQEWNLLMVGCGNSMELGVLKQQGETPGWEQWCQGEANRAELPLNEDHKDVHTVGLSFDTSVTNKINIGSDKMIEPMPFVFMLSHEGVLCMFYAINMLPNVPNLCNPPQPLPDQSGLHLFSVPQVGNGLWKYYLA
ncbi:hypothetical protein AAG570_011329 [Ranatra chinensis]|uniref:Nucleoporin Nup159/Nup146 N-terminal domain-containing protein n=1 Tax=Ranatra chinensis TaxID=642074 RepID=A0ABD0YKB1_9HEMI